MYPVSLGFEEAVKRIRRLLKNEHYAEALVTAVFSFEKLMRRSLRVAILSRGFTSKHADRILDRTQFKDLKELWHVFEKSHRTLPLMLGGAWQHIPPAVEKRNKLVHGVRVYGLADCKAAAEQVLNGLVALHSLVTKDFGCDPWTKLRARKKPKLQWLAA